MVRTGQIVVRRGEEYIRVAVVSEVVGGRSDGPVVATVLSAGREGYPKNSEVVLTDRELRQARWAIEHPESSTQPQE